MNFTELLTDLTIQLNAIIRQVAASNSLSASQVFHLIAIPHNGIAMSKLSYKLGLDTSTLTRNIQKMEALDLVSRNRNSLDKRIQILSLSKHGLHTVSQIEESLNKLNHSILNQINLDDQINIIDVLESLVWSIDCVREQ